MGLFSSGSSWSAQARRPSRASQEIINRHARQDKKAKKARKREKAMNQKFGRRGSGIVCGWANWDD